MKSVEQSSVPATPSQATPHDGFGALLRDYWDAGADACTRRRAFLQVIERDDGYVSIEDAHRYFTRPAEWIVAERRAVQLARGRVLDIGCAAGRHMLVMREQPGVQQVSGIDPSPGAVAVAVEQGLTVRIGTVLEPGTVGAFDTLALLGGNLGLLGSREEAPPVLASLARLARPGGQVLAIGHDPYRVLMPEHRAYHTRNRDRGLLPGQVRMRVRYKTWTSDWFNRLLLAPEELDELLDGSSWELRDVTYSGEVGFYLAELDYSPNPRAVRRHRC